jgi:phage-related protein
LTLEELKVVITAQTSQLKEQLNDVKSQLNKVNNETTKVTSGIQASFKKLIAGVVALKIGQKIGQAILGGIKDAMNIEAALQQIKRIMGESSNQFLKWANTQALAFNMSASDALKYGSIFGNLLSSFTSSTSEISKRTESLLKASSIIASSTGRTMQDVMERIRSGLLGNTEAIEDLGVNVNVAMLQSTDAFKRFAGNKSWDQLNFQTQQQIRLFAILEQTNKKFGDSVNENSNSQLQQLVAVLGNVRLYLGLAFLPIVQIVLPMLTSLAQGLANVMNVVAQFSQALFGKGQQGQGTNNQTKAVTGLGNSYEKTGQQAKKAMGILAGFDEINQLKGPSEIDSGASAGASDGPSMIAPLSGMSDTMLETTAKVQALAESVKTALGDMTNHISSNKDIIISALSGMAAGFIAYKTVTEGAAIATKAWAVICGVAEVATWALKTAIGALISPAGMISVAIAGLTAAFIYFYRTNESFRGFVDGVINQIKEALSVLWNTVLVPLGNFLAGIFKAAWQGIVDVATWLWQNVLVPVGDFILWLGDKVLKPLGSIIVDILVIAFNTLIEAAKLLWENVLKPLAYFISSVFIKAIESLKEIFEAWWNSALVPIGAFISDIFQPIIEGLIDVFMWLWQNVLKPITVFLVEDFLGKFKIVTEGIKEIIEGFKIVFIGILDFIAGVFTGNWEKAWLGVREIFKGIFDSLYGFVKIPLNLIIESINTVIRGLNSISIKIPDWVPGLGGKTWGMSIPSIPKLARGGIIDSPTLAMVGEAGKEAVVPLENTSFVDKLAGALGTAVMAAMQFGTLGNNSQTGDIVIQVDGVTLARVSYPYNQRESSRVGNSMITTT